MWGDNYDKEDFKQSKELLQNGMVSMLPRVLSAKNQTLEDMKCIEDYIELLHLKYAQKTQGITSQEQINNTNIPVNNNSSNKTLVNGVNDTKEIKEVGRTTLEENDIENDSTAASRDAGTNVSDIKEF